jgi:hypothetical protein
MSVVTKLSKTTFATLAFSAIASLVIAPAAANTRVPFHKPTHPASASATGSGPKAGHNSAPRATTDGKKSTGDCYYLPTVTNGSVSGLEKHCP